MKTQYSWLELSVFWFVHHFYKQGLCT